MQQSRDKYFPQFEDQGINQSRRKHTNHQIPAQTIKQTCTQHDKGVVNPFTVTCKDEIREIGIKDK